MRALVWWPVANARQMFQVLEARRVALAGISWDVAEWRTDRSMFLLKDTKDVLKKTLFSIANIKNK